MANQTDNVLLSDDTTGLSRSIDVGSDALFLSTDLTLQAGGIFEADNLKRGTVDPNVALLAGNEGDIYQRTSVAGGELWINTDGTTTGWSNLGAASAPTWAQVLANGNTSGGTSPVISSGDSILGEDNAAGAGGDIPITAGSSTGGGGDGGDVVISPGAGDGLGAPGIVQVNGVKHYASSATDPTSPSPAEGDRYYNTTLEMEMRYDGSRLKWLSVETETLVFSDSGNVPNGTYMRLGVVRTSSSRGAVAQFNGTVVGLSYTRDDTDAATFAFVGNGSTLVSVATSAASGKDVTLNTDFSVDDVLAVRNDGANGITNPHCVVRMKWRV